MAGSDEDLEAMNSQDTGALGVANSRMEDDEPALPLDPNSRLLERAQAALRAQLLTQKQVGVRSFFQHVLSFRSGHLGQEPNPLFAHKGFSWSWQF
jgi:hypothetical protein